MHETARSLVYNLCKYPSGRHHNVPGSLENSRTIITKHLTEAGCKVQVQKYEASGLIRQNIIGSIGNSKGSTISIAAHYDTVYGSPGADDNASSVTAILLTASLLKGMRLQHRIEFVFFDSEESPFFGTDAMGSYQYSQSLKDQQRIPALVVILEMVGFYRNEPTQYSQLPNLFPFDSTMVGHMEEKSQGKDNFLMLIDMEADHTDISQDFNECILNGYSELPWIETVSRNTNVSSPVYWCDGRNFLNDDIPIMLLTDTGPLRNRNYHLASDTPDTLDYERIWRLSLDLSNAIAKVSAVFDTNQITTPMMCPAE